MKQHSIFNQKSPRKTIIESNNPLHLAVKNEEIDLVIYLSKNKGLNSRNVEGNYPIHLAVITGNVKILKIIINMGCLDQLNQEGNTALHLACKDEKIEIVRLLVQSGASLTIENASNHTPIVFIETSSNLLLHEILGDKRLKL